MDDYGYDISGGGFFGKLIAVLIGIILGVVGTFAGVAAGGYFYLNRPVSTVSNELSGLTGLQYDLSAYVSEEYAEKTVLNLLGDTANALIGFVSNNGTLNDVNKISPSVGTTIDTLTQSIHDKTGIALETEELLSKKNSEISVYFTDCVNNTPLADLLTALGGDLTPLMTTLCYGTKGVDYTILNEGTENESIEMIPPAKKLLIRDIFGESFTDAIYSLPLDSLLTNIDSTNAILMYITYGEQGLHYSSYDTVNKTALMLQRQIAIDENGVVYDEYGDLIATYDESGNISQTATYDSDTRQITMLDGAIYLATETPLRTVTTSNDTIANVYYVIDLEGVKVDFRSATVGDLANGSFTEKLKNRMTIGEILGEENIDHGTILWHVKDETINSLTPAIEALTVEEIMGTDEDGNSTITEDSILWHLKSETIHTLHDAIDNLTITKVFENKIYEEDGTTIKSEWWYLLHDDKNCQEKHTDCDGKCIEDYTLTHMDNMINNMRTNINVATLGELSEHGMITGLDQTTLDKNIKTSIGPISIEFETEKEKLGDLTVNEMMSYMNAIFHAIDKIENS